MIDIDNFKINCSQISSLMGVARGNTPPTAKEITKLYGTLGKDYGELTEAQKFTAKEIMHKQIFYDPKRPSGKILSEIILIYAYEMYGKYKISKGNSSPLQTEKGVMAEPSAIELLSKIDGVEYVKNTELFENSWFKGIPDVLIKDEKGKVVKIIEIKISYDLPSFMLNKLKKEEKSHNVFELMGYMDLTKCKEGEVVHILVDMPEKMANIEEKRLKERYEALEIEPDEINEKIFRVLNNMQYSEIPDDFKIFRRKYTINRYSMKSVKQRVTLSRKWVKEIHDIFSGKSINLTENQSDYQEDNV